MALNPTHRPTAEYLKTLRDAAAAPVSRTSSSSTQPADIVSQILNFGLPAPIDIQVSGPLAESDKNFQVAQQIANELQGDPGRGGRARATDPRRAADHDRQSTGRSRSRSG